MSLWDHIDQKTLEEMAEMLRPPPEYRLVSKTYSLAIASKQHIYDISSKRRLDSLIPFSECAPTTTSLDGLDSLAG